MVIPVLIDLVGLLAAALLLVTLVALEVRRVEPGAGQPTRPKLLGRTVSPRHLAVMWAMYLVFFLPRVLGLLT